MMSVSSGKRDAFGLSSAALSNKCVDRSARRCSRCSGIAIGMLPDNGDSGGTLQMPSSLKESMGKAPAMIGLYAHVRGDIDEPFTGAELFDVCGSRTTGVR